MNYPKILAGGAAAALALGGSGVLAHELISSSPSPAAASHPSTSTRAVSDDSGTAKQVYEGAKDSVAYVVADTAQGQATGSGFVVSKDGLIVTNDHVVDGATQVQVKVGTSGKAQDARVVGVDASRDLALLKVDGQDLKPLPLGDSSKVAVGDATFAIGNPFGLDHTFTTGIVSALNRDLQSPNGATIHGAIQTDAAINPGNSGGALLDSDGNVIGVNSQIATGSQSGSGEGGNVGIGFAIPSDTVKAFISEAKSGKLAPQANQQEQTDPFGQLQQGDPNGQQADPNGQQTDPYGQQTDPYGQQTDPYGQQVDPNQQQVDPNQQQDDPWGQLDPNQQQLDPNQQQLDPNQQQLDPNQQADPYGYGLGIG
jgi:putative serine protease PepD